MWFDINLASAQAGAFYTYLTEGLYLDGNTKTFTAEIITYNAPLKIFGYFYAEFDFNTGGTIQVGRVGRHCD